MELLLRKCKPWAMKMTYFGAEMTLKLALFGQIAVNRTIDY